MTLFGIAIVGMLLMALALVLPPLLRRDKSLSVATRPGFQVNLDILREQLAQLDAEFAAGSLSAVNLALVHACQAVPDVMPGWRR